MHPVISFITLEELTGRKTIAPPDDSLQEYEGHHLLHFASKANLILHSARDPNSRRVQDDLARSLLEPNLFQRYLHLQSTHRRKYSSKQGRVLVPPLNLLFFMKRIILNHSFHGEKVIDVGGDKSSLAKVVESFLGFSHNVGDVTAAKGDASRAMELVNELVKLNAFYSQFKPENQMARYFKILFVLSKEPCKELPDVELESLFRREMGFDLRAYFTVGYWIWASHNNVSLKTNSADSKLYASWSDFVHLDIAVPELERIKSEFSAEKEFYKIRFNEFPRADERSDTFFLLPFQQKPLIRVHDSFNIITHLPFIVDKITKGVFWTIDDVLRTNNAPARGPFQKYWRYLCQRYAETVVEHDLMPDETLEVFFDTPYGAGNSKRGTDIMLFDKMTGELFMFEVTDSALNLDALTLSNNSAAFKDGIDKMVIEKCRQLDGVIEAIKNGELSLGSIKPADISRFRPILLFFSHFPLMPHIWNSIQDSWKGLNELLKEIGYLQKTRTRPLRVITIEEFDLLAEFHKGGQESMLNLIRRWAKDRVYAHYPLKHYIYYRENNLKRDSTRLETLREQMFLMMETQLK